MTTHPTAAASLQRGDLLAFDISPDGGCLPASDPLRNLSRGFEAWEDVARQLPKLLMSDQTRAIVDAMPKVDASPLKTAAEIERAMMLLSYIGHAYVWGDAKAAERIPATLAVPWHSIATKLDRPPVLSYPSYALHNWRRLDPSRGIELGNICLLQNFWGGADEEWFILIHIDIEAKAAAAIRSLIPAQRAAAENRPQDLQTHLTSIATALEKMYATMSRMPEFCDPYIYYRRVRPYIHGWKNQPALPDGLIYEGVAEYGGKPQQ